MTNNIQAHSNNEPRYSRREAASLARVTLEFWQQCEDAWLFMPRGIQRGEPMYAEMDIETAAVVRRLHDHLALDLTTIDVVLNLRARVEALLTQLAQMEQQMAEHEAELRSEIARLRRELTARGEWWE